MFNSGSKVLERHLQLLPERFDHVGAGAAASDRVVSELVRPECGGCWLFDPAYARLSNRLPSRLGVSHLENKHGQQQQRRRAGQRRQKVSHVPLGHSQIAIEQERLRGQRQLQKRRRQLQTQIQAEVRRFEQQAEAESQIEAEENEQEHAVRHNRNRRHTSQSVRFE